MSRTRLLALAAAAAAGVAFATIFPQQRFSEPAHAQFAQQALWGGTGGGTANAQTITVPNYTTPVVGVTVKYMPSTTNTGPMTLQISGGTAISVKYPTPTGLLTTSGGEVVAGVMATVTYDGSAYELDRATSAQALTGEVRDYMGTTAPAGWVFCAGQALSRTGATANLFAAIGTSFGAGDGSTTFNVADLRGRATFGKDNMNGSAAGRISVAGGNFDGTALGGAGGQQNHTITNLEMTTTSITPTFTGNSLTPTGTITNSDTSASWVTFGGNNTVGTLNGGTQLSTGAATFAGNPVTPTGTISPVNFGGSQPHTILNPVMIVNKICKL